MNMKELMSLMLQSIVNEVSQEHFLKKDFVPFLENTMEQWATEDISMRMIRNLFSSLRDCNTFEQAYDRILTISRLTDKEEIDFRFSIVDVMEKNLLVPHVLRVGVDIYDELCPNIPRNFIVEAFDHELNVEYPVYEFRFSSVEALVDSMLSSQSAFVEPRIFGGNIAYVCVKPIQGNSFVSVGIKNDRTSVVAMENMNSDASVKTWMDVLLIGYTNQKADWTISKTRPDRWTVSMLADKVSKIIHELEKEYQDFQNLENIKDFLQKLLALKSNLQKSENQRLQKVIQKMTENDLRGCLESTIEMLLQQTENAEEAKTLLLNIGMQGCISIPGIVDYETKKLEF